MIRHRFGGNLRAVRVLRPASSSVTYRRSLPPFRPGLGRPTGGTAASGVGPIRERGPDRRGWGADRGRSG